MILCLAMHINLHHTTNDILYSGQENTFIHIQANFGSPVGGLTILRHFEINCCPLTVRLTRGLVVQLYDFLRLGASDPSQAVHQASRAAFLASPTEILHPKVKNTQLKRQAPTPSSQESAGSRRPSSVSYSSSPSGGGQSNRRSSREVAFLFGDDPATSIAGQGTDQERAAYSQDVAELKKRAQRNIVFKHFRLGEINIFFSYSGM